MEPQSRIVVFLAEFDFQIGQIERIFKILKNKSGDIGEKPVADETIESAGYWMHNLYSAFEDLFKLTAEFWENNLSADGEFHINLLRRMVLNIEDIRPRLLSEASYRFLNELRGFRHAFRHAYSFGLEEDRVSALFRKTLEKKDTVIEDLQIFRKNIARMIEAG